MMKRFKSLEEELEAIRAHPAAKELLDLLKDQDRERTEQLMSELSTMAKEGNPNEIGQN